MRIAAAGLLVFCGLAAGGQTGAPSLQMEPIAPFKLEESGLTIRQRVQAGQPFTVAGKSGVILGQQEGTFEAWLLPVKLLSHFAIRGELEGDSVPIEVNAGA